MSDTKRAARVLMTGLFRASHPHLLEARAFEAVPGKPKGDPAFSIEMMYEPEQLKKFRVWNDESDEFDFVDVAQIAAQVAKGQWPNIVLKDEFKEKWPIKDGNKKAAERVAAGKKGDVYEGMKLIRAKSIESERVAPPGLSYYEGGKRLEINRGLPSDMTKAKHIFRGGNYFIAEVTCAAVESPQGKFITFYLNHVIFVREGDRIGGSGGLVGRFDGVEGGIADYDPTAGMNSGDLDDEIPF